ncbi:MAG: tyrosine-type recombinase/integrase [Planctomycetes bacterium]|nr:tyrosine-type recombinase/integrase [Planctomycetota bacterium]
MPDSSHPSGVSRPPKYSRQKREGRHDRAYVRIEGKRVYLGNFGSSESHARYADLIGGHHVEPPKLSTDPTVSELLVQFLEWANGYYDAREYGHFVIVAKWLRNHAGGISAMDFGPKRLKEIRQAMIAHGLTRKSINRQIVRIRQVFTWAVGEEIIPATNLEALRAVKGLREGRSGAKEKDPIQPVSDDDIQATIKHLSPRVADMVRVHQLIGCRPAELVSIRPQDVDRSGAVWFYSPASHKNTWRGKSRSIAIGPRAQAILQKYLFGNWCFVSQTDKGKPERYLVSSYRRAITRACKRADVEPWTPGQLRHTTASLVRKQFGLDAAQSILGHATANTTEIYAELDKSKAAEVAFRIG